VEPGELRGRYANSSGIVRRMFDHLIEVARHPERVEAHGISAVGRISAGAVHPRHRPDEACYPFLALLLTGQSGFADAGKRRLRAVLDDLPVRERTASCQLHTWRDAFPMARHMIYMSWLDDLGYLAPEEKADFRERFLSYCRFHPYERLRARCRTPGAPNNQNGSMGLACLVTALLFRDGEMFDPRVIEIRRLGMEHVVDFLTGFPRGGYSGEGSGYNLGVNAFLVVLMIEILGAATGKDWIDVRRGPGFATPGETLLAMVAQSARSGLSFPWDDYGYMRAKHAFAASYLAWKTGARVPLRTLFEAGAAFDTLHAGWGFDHRLWMLLYWPVGELPMRSGGPLDCANPATHAVIESESRRLHLLQIWDPSAWPPLREHCNPNSITMEYKGIPLLVEGRPWMPDADRFSAEGFTVPNRYGGTINIGRGSIGTHNGLVVDREDWFAPDHRAGGSLVKASWLRGAGYVCSDSTPVYAHYGLARVRRETLVVGDEWVGVRDSIDADTPHTYRWATHLPPGRVEKQDGTVRVCFPQGISLELGNDAGKEFGILPSGRCLEAGYEVRGTSARLLTTICPRDQFVEHLDLSAGWALAWVGTLERASILVPGEIEGEPHDFSQGPWFYTTREKRPGWVVLRKTFVLDSLPTGLPGIRFPRHAIDVEIELNGHPLEVPFIDGETELVFSFIGCGDALRSGHNTLTVLANSSVDNAPFGRITLGGIVQTPEGPPPEVYWQDAITRFDFCGGSATARICVRRSETAGCAFAATQIEDSDFRMTSSAPIDVAWEDDGISFGHCDLPVEVEFRMREACGTVRLGPHPGISWGGRSQVAVSFAGRDPGLGFPAGWSAGDMHQGEPLPRGIDAPLPVSVPALESICQAIDEGNWKDQVLAMDAAAGLADPVLIGKILRLLEREVREHPTPYEPREDDPTWYRLKAAAARYLGSVRHQPSVPILAEILRDRSTMYPARVAAARALVLIRSPEARAALAGIDAFDEFNVARTCREALDKWPPHLP
jgi:hypothetical protein